MKKSNVGNNKYLLSCLHYEIESTFTKMTVSITLCKLKPKELKTIVKKFNQDMNFILNFNPSTGTILDEPEHKIEIRPVSDVCELDGNFEELELTNIKAHGDKFPIRFSYEFRYRMRNFGDG